MSIPCLGFSILCLYLVWDSSPSVYSYWGFLSVYIYLLGDLSAFPFLSTAPSPNIYTYWEGSSPYTNSVSVYSSPCAYTLLGFPLLVIYLGSRFLYLSVALVGGSFTLCLYLVGGLRLCLPMPHNSLPCGLRPIWARPLV